MNLTEVDLFSHSLFKQDYGMVLEEKCLDHGFVKLLDLMPRSIKIPDGHTFSADWAVTQAARVSTGGTSFKSIQEDIGLLRYLMRHRHTTPFEMVEFKFHCKMPIFVARQWIRHRMASVNEVSARYSKMPEEFYLPTKDNVRAQSKVNKQSSDSGGIKLDDIGDFLLSLEDTYRESYRDYERALDNGVGREIARLGLPVGLYTEWIWKVDLKNLLDFLALRADAHAQKEIQVYADAIIKLITLFVPHTIQAWNDYNPLRDAILFSKQELVALSQFINGTETAIVPDTYFKSKRELDEFYDKLEKIKSMKV